MKRCDCTCVVGLLLVLLLAVPESQAVSFLVSPECGPKEACDCSRESACSANEITKYCQVCKNDLHIDSRFKGGAIVFWMLKEVRMDVIVSPDASDIKTIDMPLLKTVGGSLSIGGQRAIACPAGLEAFSAKRLTSIGTYTHGNLEVGASILQQGLPGCESLYKLDIPSLEYIGMGMAVLNNQHLQTLSLAKLSGFGLNPKNGDLQAPAAGEVLVAGNEDLKLYYAPKATQEGSTAPKYTIKENPSIKMIVAMNNDVGTFEIAPEQNIKSSLALYMLKLPKMPSLTVFPDSLKADKFEFAKLPDKLPGKELFEKLGEKLKEYEAAPTASPQ